MEPDAIDLEAGAKALTVLSFIPVIVFALWAQYFESYLNQLMIKRPQFERAPEIEKVRLASLCVLLFQLSLFLGSTEFRHAYPVIIETSFTVSMLLQLWLQSRTEKKIPPTLQKQEKRPRKQVENRNLNIHGESIPEGPLKEIEDDLLPLALRAAMSWLIGAAIYIVILMIFIRTSSLVAQYLHAPPKVGTVILLLGGSIGVIVGLGINFALSPFHLKRMLPTKTLQDPDLQKSLEACFLKAGLKPPLFHVIELKSLQFGTSLLAGFQGGRGTLRQILFISRPALKNLSPLELKAIVLNQISHIVLHHFRKRFFFSFTLILTTTVLSVISVIIGQATVSAESAFEVIGPAVALISFFMSFRLLNDQNRQHEYEADLHSIEKLGVSLDDFASALRKLDPAPPPMTPPVSLSFLETERRIQAISIYLAKKQKTETEKTLKAG